jgi:hypothetical protein
MTAEENPKSPHAKATCGAPGEQTKTGARGPEERPASEGGPYKEEEVEEWKSEKVKEWKSLGKSRSLAALGMTQIPTRKSGVWGTGDGRASSQEVRSCGRGRRLQ